MSTAPVPPALQAVARSPSPAHALVSQLRSMAIDQPRLVRATAQTVHPPHPSLPPPPPDEPPAPTTLTSWKMLEHLYRQSPCPFPTLARGLFTCWESEEDAPEPPVKGVRKGLTDKERERRDEEEAKGTWRIVARGYDKFFNVGEVGWTEWSALAEHTCAPYELTLKSNGCLILIAALTPSRLLVTSKHSLGTRTDTARPYGQPPTEFSAAGQLAHAERGEQWLRAHLVGAGKTESELAKTLWEKNVTAVAELCDDAFEEHVLPIPKDLTGLVLHGLVPNSPVFETAPAQEVKDFALEWGLKPTEIVTLSSVGEVREFCRKGAEKGEWEGIGVEGWVVRCRVRDPSQPADKQAEQKTLDDLTEEIANLVISDPGDAPVSKDGSSEKDTDRKGRRTSTPPYPPGAPFFFKVKFEEPYLMYREWRELTKTLLPVLEGREPADFVGTPMQARTGKGKKELITIPTRFKKRPETRKYARWVIREMKENPDAFKEYKFNRGIIEVREKYLRWAGMESPGGFSSDEEGEEGKVGKVVDAAREEMGKKEWKKTILVPVAIPGCGKTSVAVALRHLWGIGHTQSDDVPGKKSAPQFLKNVGKLLKDHDVVFADRNNHLYQHRRQLREVADECKPGPVRLVALNWSLTSAPVAQTHRLCSERIIARGENHQSLRPLPSSVAHHEDVLWNFIRQAEPCDEDEVDEVVEMDVRNGFEENVRRGVDEVARVMGWEKPGEERMREAVEVARGYEVPERNRRKEREEKKAQKEKTKEKAKEKDDEDKKKVLYYGLLAELDFPALLDPILLPSPDTAQDDPLARFWADLVKRKAYNLRPHITLWHMNDPDSEDGQRLAEKCREMAGRTDAPLWEFGISHIVCDGKVMALVVDPSSIHAKSEKEEDLAWLDALGDRRDKLHITVGTRSKDVKNVEGGRLVAEWRAGKEGVWARELKGVRGVGTVKGTR